MTKLKVFKTTSFPQAAEKAFEEAFDVTEARLADPIQELCESQFYPEALLCSIDVRLNAGTLARLPGSIRAIATYSVGLDHIDLAAAKDRGLSVFNTPGVLDDAVADVAILLMLGATRRATESIDLLRSGKWSGWTPTQLIGFELAGRTLGILGMGAVGSKIAKRARSFGMNIAYSDLRPTDRAGSEARFFADPEELLTISDIFVLACPSTPATRGFINVTRLQKVRPELVIVNIGRGDLVDDNALIEALSERRIFAAGLDVFHGEPHLDKRYLDLSNAFLTPHIGSSTLEARQRMAGSLISALKGWQNGQPVSNQVV